MNLLLILLLACCCANAHSTSRPTGPPRCIRHLGTDMNEVVEAYCPGQLTPPTRGEASSNPEDPVSQSTVKIIDDGRVQPEKNPEQLNYVNHGFYKSGFVYNTTYFDAYWKNITSGSHRTIVHPTLENASNQHIYRDFALQISLPFDFPFYGHYLKEITVSTGGYVFTGESGHRWFAQDQNISPLMANFDLSLCDNSAIVLYEEATRLTIVWENMMTRQRQMSKFTFAVTLYKNGDIFFAYKNIPMDIQAIDCRSYSIFVGVADSYFINEVTINVHRKLVHNYSRIPFNRYNIYSKSVLQLIAQKSCPIYNTCKACLEHEDDHGDFKCVWCDSLQKCTSGADFFRPYMSDCAFSKSCNSNSFDNETLPHLSFFRRIFHYSNN